MIVKNKADPSVNQVVQICAFGGVGTRLARNFESPLNRVKRARTFPGSGRGSIPIGKCDQATAPDT